MKLTNNFSLNEFRSKDGSEFPPQVLDNIIQLSEALQVVRDHFGKAITITSGYRSPAHNRKVGGAQASLHVSGKAADFVVRDIQPSAVADAIEQLIADGKLPEGGLGRYNTWTHYDIRGSKARWDKTSK
jgi:uncharacterized protein YcbK (DUF882 family)